MSVSIWLMQFLRLQIKLLINIAIAGMSASSGGVFLRFIVIFWVLLIKFFAFFAGLGKLCL